MTTLKERLERLDPERRARILAETDRLEAEYLTLRDLRRARELTQVELARKLGKSQVAIARMEKRGDLMLSTLRSVVESMGGKLDLVATFPDRPPVVLDGLADGGEREPKAP